MTNVLLNNVEHHDLRIVERRGAELGDAVNQVLAFPTEFEALQREYPIVFRKSAEGPLRPVALLGLERGENLFLDGNGGWQADYVPALMQRGPFSIAAPESGSEPVLLVDLDHPRVSRTEGAPVFRPQGGNTPYLERMRGVLQTIYLGNELLDPMMTAFSQARLLKPVNLDARIGEAEVRRISEVFTIDRERLAAFDGDELAALHRGGFLQSAFLAAASLGNFQRLVERKSRRLAEAQE